MYEQKYILVDIDLYICKPGEYYSHTRKNGIKKGGK